MRNALPLLFCVAIAGCGGGPDRASAEAAEEVAIEPGRYEMVVRKKMFTEAHDDAFPQGRGFCVQTASILDATKMVRRFLPGSEQSCVPSVKRTGNWVEGSATCGGVTSDLLLQYHLEGVVSAGGIEGRVWIDLPEELDMNEAERARARIIGVSESKMRIERVGEC